MHDAKTNETVIRLLKPLAKDTSPTPFLAMRLANTALNVLGDEAHGGNWLARHLNTVRNIARLAADSGNLQRQFNWGTEARKALYRMEQETRDVVLRAAIGQALKTARLARYQATETKGRVWLTDKETA